MAEKKSGADFVARIVKDPANPPQTAMLTGYLGASTDAGHTRLYFDPGLSDYAEIPDDAILHREDAGGEGGLGATHIWVKRDAELIYGPPGPQRPKGKFLEGPIAAQAAGAAGGAAAAPITALPICGPHLTFAGPCPTPLCLTPHCLTVLPTPCCLTPHCPPTPLHGPCPTPLCSWAPPCPISHFGVCHVTQPVVCQLVSANCSLGCQVGPGPVAQAAAAPVTMPVQVCATPPQTVLGCPTHAPFQCPHTQIGCPTHAPFFCPTPPVVCASAHVGCPTYAPFLCPTHAPLHCPSGHIGCPTHAPFLCPLTAVCVLSPR